MKQKLACLLAAPLLSLFSMTIPAKEIGSPIQLSDQVASTDHYMKIQLRGSLVLTGDKRLAELSDLAWDEDEQLLYGITDRGWLLHMKPKITEDTLQGMSLYRTRRLLDKRSKPLRRARRDAEGLAIDNSNNGIKGDSTLLVSFEHEHRIMLYDTNGVPLKQLKQSPLLARAIAQTTKNKGMEALALHPKLGLLTGPERPPFGIKDNKLISNQGKQWLFTPLETAGSMVALEPLPDGGILMLERAFISPFQPWIISIARISKQQLESNSRVVPEILAQFDSSKGWRTLNFEGLTHHKGRRFFMASDDNNQSYAATQIVYFELLDD